MSGRVPLIDIQNASLYRGGKCVFEDLTLRIQQREHVVILGPNGAGKTTLVKAFNRELYPRARGDSHLRILGRERWNVWTLRRQFGIVSADLQQRYRATATARDVVLSGFFSSIGVHGTLARDVTAEQHDKARELLETFLPPDAAGKQFARLSTGEQRRTLLARALVHEPHTLMLDEPAAGLDLGARFDLMARLQKLAAEETSIIIVTHHLHEILPQTQRVILLKHGAILADGPPGEVLTSATLSEAYDTQTRVVRSGDWYFALPATT
ncbi:MAG: ATP-binding cassette domain-containing protein [Pseudomonadota bacterium]